MSYEIELDNDYELDYLTEDIDDQIYSNSDMSGYYYSDEFEEIELDE